MPIELPNLDDIDYDELISGAIAALPGYGSDWTDYNPSDPGITLLEMLAWLTEMLVYRTNRIQPATYEAFLQLLMGYGAYQTVLQELAGHPGSAPGDMDPPIHAGRAAPGERFESEPELAARDVLLALRGRYRAVTADDYRQLALSTFPKAGQIERLACLPGVDATDTSSGEPASLEGAISLVVLPVRAAGDLSSWPRPSSDLERALKGFFENRRLATTRVRIAGPRYVGLQVAATLYIDGDAHPREVLPKAHRALFEYLHPARGGSDREGWPFGRTVHSADLTARLAGVAGVAFVEEVSVTKHNSGDGDSVPLDDDQLPQLPRDNIGLSAKVLSGSPGRDGSEWDDWSPEVTVV